MRMRFNVNDKVRVKLTDRGREALRANHDQLFSNLKEKAPPFTLPKEDADGWSEWQLWCLMAELGPHLTMGMFPPFETEIEIIAPRTRGDGD